MQSEDLRLDGQNLILETTEVMQLLLFLYHFMFPFQNIPLLESFICRNNSDFPSIFCTDVEVTGHTKLPQIGVATITHLNHIAHRSIPKENYKVKMFHNTTE